MNPNPDNFRPHDDAERNYSPHEEPTWELQRQLATQREATRRAEQANARLRATNEAINKLNEGYWAQIQRLKLENDLLRSKLYPNGEWPDGAPG